MVAGSISGSVERAVQTLDERAAGMGPRGATRERVYDLLLNRLGPDDSGSAKDSGGREDEPGDGEVFIISYCGGIGTSCAAGLPHCTVVPRSKMDASARLKYQRPAGRRQSTRSVRPSPS